MLNSLILMFSQYGQNRKISNIFKIIWSLYAITASFFNSNLLFSLITISVFIFITGSIHGISKLLPKVNAFLSVVSILIYSFIVDVSCYYAFSSWVNDRTLFKYILDGFLFNYKYVIINAVVFSAVLVVSKILNKYRFERKSVTKKCVGA